MEASRQELEAALQSGATERLAASASRQETEAALQAEATARQAAEDATRRLIEERTREASDRGRVPVIQQQQPRVPVIQQQQGYRSQAGPSLIMSQNNMRVPRFEGTRVYMWSSTFQAFLTVRGLISTLEPTSDPIRVSGGLGGMAE